MKYMMNSALHLRKEFFGCTVTDTLLGTQGQFNHTAYKLFKSSLDPVSLPSLGTHIKSQSSKDELIDFVQNQIKQGRIIALDSKDIEPAARAEIYFDGIPGDMMPQNCLVAPSSVTIYLTERCPKQCRHCIVNSGPTVSQANDFNVDQWRIALAHLKNSGVPKLVVTGGEVMIHPQVFEILKVMNDLNFNIHLLTDFDGLKERHIEAIKNLPHISYLQTSLDGGAAQSHDAIRGQGSFELTMKRLKLLQTSKIPYTISVAVSKKNIGEIDKIVSIYHKYGARNLYLNPLVPYGRGSSISDLVLNKNELEHLSKVYYQLISSGKIRVNNPYWNIKSNQVSEKNPFEEAIHAFSIATHNFSVGPSGDCTLDSKVKSLGTLKLGNILKNDMASMWFDQRLVDLRKKYRADRYHFVPLKEFSETLASSVSSLQKEDIPLIASLYRRTWQTTYPMAQSKSFLQIKEEEVRQTLNDYLLRIDPCERVIVARMKSKLAGFAHCKFDHENKECLLLAIYVDPHMQGKGVGMKLINESKRFAIGHNSVSIKIKMWSDNPSKKFFGRMGAKDTRQEAYKVINGHSTRLTSLEIPLIQASAKDRSKG